MMRIIWILVILSAFLVGASAITCYECNSLSDPRCDHAKGVKETNCDEAEMPQYLKKFERRIEARGCITKIYTNIQVDRDFLYIRRGCFFGFVDDTKEACGQKDPYVPWAKLIDCEVCKEDLCNNSGHKSTFSKIFLLITIILGFLLNAIL